MVWSLGKSLPICNAWLSGGIWGHSQILVLNRCHFKCCGLLPCPTTAESRGFAPLPVRAVSSDDSTSDAVKQFEELYADLKAKVSYSDLLLFNFTWEISQSAGYKLDIPSCYTNWNVRAMLQWDGLENKTTVVVYAGGALVALWLSSTIVGAINSVPLVCPSYLMNHRIGLHMQILRMWLHRCMVQQACLSVLPCEE
jgi:hypothetical protein